MYRDEISGWKDNELSLRVYNLCIGLILLYGFVVNYFMCKNFTNVFAEWNIGLIIVGYFIVCFIGIIISVKSTNPFVSFIGYNMVVVPVGVVLSIAINEYDNSAIMNGIMITGAVTALMVLLSTIYPQFFGSIGKGLFIALTCTIVIELIFLIFGIVKPGIWDALIALLFALYIGYDWAKAQETEHTLDNAVDACVDLYLDIINLFLRVLGSSSNKSRGK